MVQKALLEQVEYEGLPRNNCGTTGFMLYIDRMLLAEATPDS